MRWGNTILSVTVNVGSSSEGARQGAISRGQLSYVCIEQDDIRWNGAGFQMGKRKFKRIMLVKYTNLG